MYDFFFKFPITVFETLFFTFRRLIAFLIKKEFGLNCKRNVFDNCVYNIMNLLNYADIPN